jgi:hypothetical protein
LAFSNGLNIGFKELKCYEKTKSAPSCFILGSGCEPQPLIPACTVWAMKKAINDFGWYE